MDKYTKYTTEDFLADDSFIQWLIDPTEEQDNYWNAFLQQHPEKKHAIDEAKIVFGMFQHERERLSLDETYDIWNNILKTLHNPATSRWLNILKYAAILLVVFLAGGISYYLYESREQTHFDLASVPVTTSSEAKIILSDGSEISLEKKESEISYNSSGNQLIVNNDTIRQNQVTGREVMNKVIIPYGKKSMIQLSDGTLVWLNAGSQLIYPSTFQRKKREVVLIGEAYFDVAKNPSKPFIVRTADMHVKVLGTRFDVSAYPEDPVVETILEEGSVALEVVSKKFAHSGEEVILKPNQKISLNKEDGVANIKTVDVSMYTSWKDGILKTDREDLVRVIKKVERYYNIQIEMKDPLAGGYLISGKLDLKGSPEEVLNIIKLTVPIDWTKKSNGDFVIVRK
ncbi:FecR family protein [Gaoshiqia sediminis]|uniref:FecR domain-containing protein n=1 Tax=Gaoshiqia sediminis TaxID=2986998 RepID=A0AA42CA25_9BACT|nr:FecR domain-containing protein [Gaoshiqia sediminis]MCW0483212.1 FecR domain-containing protein [Gaoshiqia sediminis]